MNFACLIESIQFSNSRRARIPWGIPKKEEVEGASKHPMIDTKGVQRILGKNRSERKQRLQESINIRVSDLLTKKISRCVFIFG